MQSDTISIISLVVSALALIVSIVMPIIAYIWLDPKLQELRHVPKLHIIRSSSTKLIVDEKGNELSADKQASVTLTNQGRLPASDIKVVFHSDGQVADLNLKVTTDPPCPHKVEKSGNSAIVTLDRVIGNGQ